MEHRIKELIEQLHKVCKENHLDHMIVVEGTDNADTALWYSVKNDGKLSDAVRAIETNLAK